MELLLLLWANAETIVATLGGIVTVASLVTASTKTPDPTTWVGKAYKVVEVLGLVIGRAKDGR
ncbi:hypothetical protein [Caenispirillum bisanense]|uniref:hypothetical protein n=1 Tax=Caenispirillum bisanense TaxID=414052 RepID=UPI000BE380F6|nr:hypothetical protein [Caenispirillum bisanense]